MTAPRSLRAALRRALGRDGGATDPILVIAAIAVSLVLLVGGSFAVAGIISNGHDLNAKADLDHVATAEASVSAAVGGGAWAYDSGTGSAYRALEGSSVGFTPSDDTRVIVDVSGNDWVAVATSATGRQYIRTSASAATAEVTSAYTGAAALGAAGAVRSVRTTIDVPAAFTSTNLKALADTPTSSAFDFTRGGTRIGDLPGKGSRADGVAIIRTGKVPTPPPPPDPCPAMVEWDGVGGVGHSDLIAAGANCTDPTLDASGQTSVRLATAHLAFRAQNGSWISPVTVTGDDLYGYAPLAYFACVYSDGFTFGQTKMSSNPYYRPDSGQITCDAEYAGKKLSTIVIFAGMTKDPTPKWLWQPVFSPTG